MAAVKLTKNELKVQKDHLKQFERYLPTLQLKKQQLQTVIMKKSAEHDALQAEYDSMAEYLNDWIAVYAENTLFEEDRRIENLIRTEQAIFSRDNVAGVSIPVFKELTFRDVPYDVMKYPLWVDTALVQLKKIAGMQMQLRTIEKQIELLGAELRSTSQRVNLFEKVKIPQTRENIRVIGIYLGDQQTSAVVRGKIAKAKKTEADA